jgi:hypothetical protein
VIWRFIANQNGIILGMRMMGKKSTDEARACPAHSSADVSLASLAIALWRHKKYPQTVKQWGRFTIYSIVLGVAFFGVDFLIALLNGQANPLHFPGGLLGLPLTLLVCPGGTIICLAGLARAFYINRGHVGSE